MQPIDQVSGQDRGLGGSVEGQWPGRAHGHRAKVLLVPGIGLPSDLWVKILQMSGPSPKKADHPSLQMHRRQLWTQILLPILLVSLLLLGIIALASVSAFRGNGDVGRWAAISTIWLVIPAMVAGLVVLAALAILIYLAWSVVRFIPPYSLRTQRLLHRVEATTKRGAEMVRRPTSAVRAFAGFVRGRLDRKPERT